jgi:hypothetical protein
LAVRLDARLCACGHWSTEHSPGGLCDECECESFAPVKLCGGALTPSEERERYFRALRGEA